MIIFLVAVKATPILVALRAHRARERLLLGRSRMRRAHVTVEPLLLFETLRAELAREPIRIHGVLILS